MVFFVNLDISVWNFTNFAKIAEVVRMEGICSRIAVLKYCFISLLRNVIYSLRVITISSMFSYFINELKCSSLSSKVSEYLGFYE